MPNKNQHVTLGTKEWADYNVNCAKGCTNDCKYCYAKMIAMRFGRCTNETWKDMKLNTKSIEKNYRKYDGRVMFPSSHDITEDPLILKGCLTVLKNLLEAGNEVLVTTKPFLSVVNRILTDYSEYKDQIQFRFTITSNDSGLLSFWEPNAPDYPERKQSLIKAYNKGYKTSVSIEPFLDRDPTTLVNELLPYVTESLWVGPMNYLRRNNLPLQDEPYYSEMRSIISKENLEQVHENLSDFEKIRFKDSLLNKLGIPTASMS